MAVLTLSDTDIARFAGAFEFSLMQSGISREELAEEAGVHVSQFSKLKSEPDLLKIFAFAHKLGALEERKRHKGLHR